PSTPSRQSGADGRRQPTDQRTSSHQPGPLSAQRGRARLGAGRPRGNRQDPPIAIPNRRVVAPSPLVYRRLALALSLLTLAGAPAVASAAAPAVASAAARPVLFVGNLGDGT